MLMFNGKLASYAEVILTTKQGDQIAYIRMSGPFAIAVDRDSEVEIRGYLTDIQVPEAGSEK